MRGMRVTRRLLKAGASPSGQLEPLFQANDTGVGKKYPGRTTWDVPSGNSAHDITLAMTAARFKDKKIRDAQREAAVRRVIAASGPGSKGKGCIGHYVLVAVEFVSDCEHRVHLKRGQVGRIREVDYEGDVLIAFDGLDGEYQGDYWVGSESLCNIAVSAELTRPRRSSPDAQGIEGVMPFGDKPPIPRDASGRPATTKGGLPMINSIALSGAGWLLPFHIGVVNTLIEAGCLTEKTVFAGASGGALVAAGYAAGLNRDQMMEGVYRIQRSAAANGLLMKGREPIEQFLRSSLTEDAVKLCAGRLIVAVTHTSPQRSLREPALIKEWESVDDLVESLIASCWIPLYLGPSLTVPFRGGTAVDGGLNRMVPPVDGAVRVCPFPGTVSGRRTFLGRQLVRDGDCDISPDLVAKRAPLTSLRDLLPLVLAPGRVKTLDMLYDNGETAALAWLEEKKDDRSVRRNSVHLSWSQA